MDTVYCLNETCDYGTENDELGDWVFECPLCGQENLVEEN